MAGAVVLATVVAGTAPGAYAAEYDAGDGIADGAEPRRSGDFRRQEMQQPAEERGLAEFDAHSEVVGLELHLIAVTRERDGRQVYLVECVCRGDEFADVLRGCQ